MSAFDVPIVKVEIQGLQQSLVTALNTYEGSISKALQDEVHKFVMDYDYSGAIRKLLPGIMERTIQRGLEDALTVSPAARELRDRIAVLGVEQLEAILLEMKSGVQT